jgi:hypothetical protein
MFFLAPVYRESLRFTLRLADTHGLCLPAAVDSRLDCRLDDGRLVLVIDSNGVGAVAPLSPEVLYGRVSSIQCPSVSVPKGSCVGGLFFGARTSADGWALPKPLQKASETVIQAALITMGKCTCDAICVEERSN